MKQKAQNELRLWKKASDLFVGCGRDDEVFFCMIIFEGLHFLVLFVILFYRYGLECVLLLLLLLPPLTKRRTKT